MVVALNSVSTFVYFKFSDFACKDNCGLFSVDIEVVKSLDRIRAKLGAPIIVLSGCRCKKRNEAEGGAEHSRHVPENCTNHPTISDAVDVTTQPAFLDKLYALMQEEFNGIGDGRKKGRFIHGDKRPLKSNGSKTFWSY